MQYSITVTSLYSRSSTGRKVPSVEKGCEFNVCRRDDCLWVRPPACLRRNRSNHGAKREKFKHFETTVDEKRDGKADMHFVSNVRVLAHAALLAIAHRKFKEA